MYVCMHKNLWAHLRVFVDLWLVLNVLRSTCISALRNGVKLMPSRLTDPLTHSLTHSLTYSLTHSCSEISKHEEGSPKGIESFVVVVVGRAKRSNHHSLRITSERVLRGKVTSSSIKPYLKKASQLRVAVWHVPFPLCGMVWYGVLWCSHRHTPDSTRAEITLPRHDNDWLILMACAMSVRLGR